MNTDCFFLPLVLFQLLCLLKIEEKRERGKKSLYFWMSVCVCVCRSVSQQLDFQIIIPSSLLLNNPNIVGIHTKKKISRKERLENNIFIIHFLFIVLSGIIMVRYLLGVTERRRAWKLWKFITIIIFHCRLSIECKWLRRHERAIINGSKNSRIVNCLDCVCVCVLMPFLTVGFSLYFNLVSFFFISLDLYVYLRTWTSLQCTFALVSISLKLNGTSKTDHYRKKGVTTTASILWLCEQMIQCKRTNEPTNRSNMFVHAFNKALLTITFFRSRIESNQHNGPKLNALGWANVIHIVQRRARRRRWRLQLPFATLKIHTYICTLQLLQSLNGVRNGLCRRLNVWMFCSVKKFLSGCFHFFFVYSKKKIFCEILFFSFLKNTPCSNRLSYCVFYRSNSHVCPLVVITPVLPWLPCANMFYLRFYYCSLGTISIYKCVFISVFNLEARTEPSQWHGRRFLSWRKKRRNLNWNSILKNINIPTAKYSRTSTNMSKLQLNNAHTII